MDKKVKSKAPVTVECTDDYDETVCVVCFRTVEIYSIGECDHPVCHECSTRMRVLCLRTECPICRKDMAMVVFSSIIKNFSSFQYRNMKCERRYHIYFENDIIMQAYDDLLEHRCRLCSTNPKFNNFVALKDHMKKNHEQFFCDLCIDNLKIFTKERRSYSRQTLAQHRRKGDIDDKSHKGHPLCEFCDTRFMDSDELFRHLRRDHYFCHFCDADGMHQYYEDYAALRKHFISDHFVCEEGSCEEERFTSVFRTKLDFQAHTSQYHGHMMSKAQARHARTVDIAFTVNHRKGQNPERGGYRGGGRGGPSRRPDDLEEQAAAAAAMPPSTNAIASLQSIDINCSQDFPSLGKMALGTAGEGGANKSIAQKLSHHNKFTIRASRVGTLNEEEFPSLGPSNVPPTTSVQLSVNSTAPAVNHNVSIRYNCNELPRSSKPRSEGLSGNITVKNPTGTKPKSTMVEDFPSLQSNPISVQKLSSTWAKSNPSQAIKAPKKPTAPPKPPPPTNGKIFESNDFPSLAPSSSIPQMLNYSGRSSLMIPVKKVNNSIKSNENDDTFSKKKKKGSAFVESNKNSQNKSKKKPLTLNNIFDDDSDPETPYEDYSKGRMGEYESYAPSRSSNVKFISSVDENSKKSELNIGALTPVPDLSVNDFPSLGSTNRNTKVTKQSTVNENQRNNKKKTVASNKSSGASSSKNNVSSFGNTNMTFTSSLGEKFAIAPTGGTFKPSKQQDCNGSSAKNSKKDMKENIFNCRFLLPPNFEQRNKALINTVNALCNGNTEKFNKFKHLAATFRNGEIKGQEYYEKCRQVMGKSIFLNVLPELLALLPDISKQQAVLEAYKKVDGARSNDVCFAVCAICQQVSIADDFSMHMARHNELQEDQFPSLKSSVSNYNAK